MTILLIHPGASHSTADVEAGLRAGLERLGVDVIQYRLDGRLKASEAYLTAAYRRAKKTQPAIDKPTWADVVYQAGMGALERALRFQVDAVLVVSAILLHPDVIILLRRAGLPVAALFTESPYDLDQELTVARLVDTCWTNERSCLPAFQAVQPNAGYLPCAWHPDRHTPVTDPDTSVPAHDVVFVGSGFPSRIDFLAAMDWTGIDLGLYGTWQNVSKRHPLRGFVHQGVVDNRAAVALYRRAKLGLNLYRGGVLVDGQPLLPSLGDSLNPRAYELAACGVFHLSEARAELTDVFGDLVPTFTTPAEASALVRWWFPRDAERARRAAQLSTCVAGASWDQRAARVVRDLELLVSRRRAA